MIGGEWRLIGVLGMPFTSQEEIESARDIELETRRSET
jgi:hypothetical protein